MIGRLTGTIETTGQSPLIIDVHDVGYTVFVTSTEQKNLKSGQKTTLYIHTHVRDDALDLFGFSQIEDLKLFKLLLTVSGVGPKTGLSIIDRGANGVEKAVMNADIDFFTTIPRLGKKNAQKIIIELKNKLGGLRDIDLSDSGGSETKQILDALTAMGFDRRDATETIRQLNPADTLEQKIRSSLKLLGKRA
ncbi:MAG TPA: Holliday junction branch migration protein RuvA [Patescibacteria group bacterium]|nr:Holliday junction branch migration protein RuvA [Patescibacteria group bacterium]